MFLPFSKNPNNSNSNNHNNNNNISNNKDSISTTVTSSSIETGGHWDELLSRLLQILNKTTHKGPPLIEDNPLNLSLNPLHDIGKFYILLCILMLAFLACMKNFVLK